MAQPMAQPPIDPRQELLNKYFSGDFQQSQESIDAKMEYDERALGMQQELMDLAETSGKGPSESEKWFRIAAALGAPTKTGNFFESLGNANAAMVDLSKDERKAAERANEYRMAAGKFALSLQADNLAFARNIDAESRDKTALAVQQILSDQSVEKQAKLKQDFTNAQNKNNLLATQMGFTLGTPEHSAQVVKLATLDWSTAQAALDDKYALKGTELKLYNDALEAMSGGPDALVEIDKLIALNDFAYSDSIEDQAKYALDAIGNPEGERYIATEMLRNKQGKVALATLKATFGGNISDGERAANEALTGTEMKSKTARGDLFNNMKRLHIARMEKAQRTIDRLQARSPSELFNNNNRGR
tara:strand:+ start:1 stop:1080 length:1080 start_codon:yes stop_codon:yes gene_type:complete